MGAVGMLLIGSKTSLNYLKVKISRGKRVLVFVKTKFSWVSVVAVKKDSTLIWKYDKSPYTTTIEDGNIQKYHLVECCYVDLDKPTISMSIKEGSLYPSDFDPVTFNNLLIRALTRPNFDGTEQLKKMIFLAIIFSLLSLVGIFYTYLAVKGISCGVVGGVI